MTKSVELFRQAEVSQAFCAVAFFKACTTSIIALQGDTMTYN